MTVFLSCGRRTAITSKGSGSSSLHQTASHQSRGGVVGMDWLFSGGVAAKNVDDGSVVNLLDFLYAVLDSLMKSVFL